MTPIDGHSSKLSQNSEQDVIEDAVRELYPAGRRIQRVLLVAPPDVDSGLFDAESVQRGRCWNFPPYGLGIISRLLLNDGLSVHVVNLNHEVLKQCRLLGQEFDFDGAWQKRLDEELQTFSPDLVGITCMFTQTHSIAVRVCSFLKEQMPTAAIALGGVHITNCFQERETLKHLLDVLKQVDLFFLYEAEYAFRKFIRVVNGSEDTTTLYQIHFTKRDLTCPAVMRPSGVELDLLPAHELLDTAELSRHGSIGSFYCLKKPETRFTTILSNRGCRGSCTFCSVRGFNGKGIRSRSIGSIIEELHYLKDAFDVGHVMWLDDDLFFDQKRAIALFNEIARQNIGITWDCTNGVIAASCSEELIAAAAASGCIGLNIGVESGNPEILKSIKKPAKIRDFYNAAQVLKRHPEINARVFLMLGFPGETVGMIRDTYEVAKAMDLDWYNITILQLLPNTPIFDEVLVAGGDVPIDAAEVRYNSGVYGRKREDMCNTSRDQKQVIAFSELANDVVPDRRQLDDIWQWFNFHLNFARLADITSPVKLNQQYCYVKNITDMVAPDDPFPIYFFAYLQHKMHGTIDSSLLARLEAVLGTSEKKRKVFSHYGLSSQALASGHFPTCFSENALSGT
ncbi:B12-binding domain-containing radical SAM protein [Trichlorobacter lovleyi]|uniref:B12-binding domain-containing radical SAM protein n=1 Tax=Trichlorobacter lovleyi TaxID=313985 RepID=UPI003D12D338